MDIEKTMNFILDRQARTEATLDQVAQEVALVSRNQAKTDRQLQATAKLVRAGIKLVVDIGRAQKEVAAAQKELAAAQKITDQRLSKFIESLSGKQTNGRRRPDR